MESAGVMFGWTLPPQPCPCGYVGRFKDGCTACTCAGLRNHVGFPAAHLLPGDNEACMVYFRRTGANTLTPFRNWCLVGEILRVFNDVRPRVHLRTRFGEELILHFYHPRDQQPATFAWADLTAGSTLLVAFAERHGFLDGTQGVRLEDLSRVRVVPAEQAAVLLASDRLAAAAVATAGPPLGSGDGGAPAGAAVAAAGCWRCGKAPGQQAAAGVEGPLPDPAGATLAGPPSASAECVSSAPLAALKTCGKCHLAKYCSRECQLADWRPAGQHKQLCKHLGGLQAATLWSQRPFSLWSLWD